MRSQPYVIPLEKHRPDQAHDPGFVGKIPIVSARRCRVSGRSGGLGLCNLVRCWRGKRQVGQRVVFAPRHGHWARWRSDGSIHQVGPPGPAGADLLRGMAPGIASLPATGLSERLPDRFRAHPMPAFQDMGEGITHLVNPAVLLVRAFLGFSRNHALTLEDPCSGSLQASMGHR